MAQGKQIRLGTMRGRVQSLASLSGLRILCCCGCAIAPIRPLAWEPSYTLSAALKKQQQQQK